MSTQTTMQPLKGIPKAAAMNCIAAILANISDQDDPAAPGPAVDPRIAQLEHQLAVAETKWHRCFEEGEELRDLVDELQRDLAARRLIPFASRREPIAGGSISLDGLDDFDRSTVARFVGVLRDGHTMQDAIARIVHYAWREGVHDDPFHPPIAATAFVVEALALGAPREFWISARIIAQGDMAGAYEAAIRPDVPSQKEAAHTTAESPEASRAAG